MSSLMKFELTPYILEFEAGADYPAKRRAEIFQVTDRTAAGTLQVENLGVTATKRVLNFNLMSKTDYDALLNWYLNVSVGAASSFEFTDEYGNVGTVKILDDEINFDETSLYRYSGSITLEYV